MRGGGWFREARSARGREMNAKMAVTRRSTGRRRGGRSIDRPKKGGRGKRRGFVSSLAGEFWARGGRARSDARGRTPRPAMRRLSRSRAGDVRTRSDPRSGRGGRGTHVDGHEEEAALVGRVSGPDDGGVPVEDVIVRPRTRAARGGRVLLEILRCGSSSMGDVWTVSVGRECARAIGSRRGSEAPGRGSVRHFFGGAPFLERARKKIGMARGNPTGAVAIAAGATFVRARTCSSLVIRLDAIVNLRWLCEKRDSGGRGKPRLVVNGERRNKRDTRDFLTASRRW